MTISQLNKLFYIKRDLKALEDELAELNNLGSAPLTDMPKAQKVSDPTTNYAIKKERIISKINKTREKYLTEYEKINDYIEDIDEPDIKLIARLRFIKHLDWYAIAEEISPENKMTHWTTPRKKLNRYLEKKEKGD